MFTNTNGATDAAVDYRSGDLTRSGQSKVDRYKWSIKDARGEYMSLHKNELFVDNAYQRGANDYKVKDLARGWSWMACGAILVAARQDGTLFVFDGQHRVLAARKRSDITTLDCLVFSVDEIVSEASGFLKSNTNRKPVNMHDKFKAMLICEDPNAVAVSKLIEEVGLRIDPCGRAGCFQALAWAMKANARSTDCFAKTLRIVAGIAGNDHPIHERVCRGIFTLHMKHRVLDDHRFVRRLNQVGYRELIDGADRASVYYGKGGENPWSQGILNAVNKGLRNRFCDGSDED